MYSICSIFVREMNKLHTFKHHLKPGRVYRRADLAKWSTAVDRHVAELVKEGVLEKLSPGLYHVPRKTVFGSAPPDDKELVRSFLKDDEFLITSPNAYNSLGVGTTQLYNKRVVYNHKRHGLFMLGGKEFFFHAKHRFPNKLTPEFLLVDLLNNLNELAEDTEQVRTNALAKAKVLPTKTLKQSVTRYGNIATKRLLLPVLKEANDAA